MENITRTFPGVVANQDVQIRVERGTFHALIGENGAGKSTLLHILYGRLQPDVGRIFLDGTEVTGTLRSPADSIKRGVGMVSQHYALIPALTVLENILLGTEPTQWGGWIQSREAKERIHSLAKELEIPNLDLNQRAERLTVAAQQKVEILKALYKDAKILLLDEPTATLAPQEADSLFRLLLLLVERGTTVLFVTHKLREVMTFSHRVTVLRRGQNAGDFVTAQTDSAELLHCMIGSHTALPLQPLNADTEPHSPTAYLGESWATPPSPANASPLLQIERVTVKSGKQVAVVQEASIEVGRGEIVGVAGVDGSGQKELAEAVIGLQSLSSGRLFLGGKEITPLSVSGRQSEGIAYIPEDRHHVGLVLDFSVSENYLLGHQRDSAWGGGAFIHPTLIGARATAMVGQYDVRLADIGASLPARNLSGGNQQKIVIARAMESHPRLLVACQPTRGLDVEASRFVYKTLRNARQSGLGVLLFSLDLDEIFELSDRIAVMFNGRVVTVLPREEATPEIVGAWMTGAMRPATEEVGR
jgi:simple sugar transport system ATP-binding protein